MRRIAVVGAVTLALAAGPTAAAWASWSGTGNASAAVGAATVKKPAAPTVVRSGTNAAISWTATMLTDNTTAVTGYSILRHNGATTTTVCTTTAPAVTCSDTSPPPGTVTYGVIARYKTNWVSAESSTTSFAMDAIAPVTTGSWSGTKTNGWVMGTSSTVSLSATDAQSGVASITYKIGSAAPVTVTSAATSFTVNAQGATTVTYHATDNAGNVESDRTLVVQLDDVAPTVAMTFPNANGPFTSTTWGTNCRDGSNNPIAGICGTTTDTASGTDTIQYRVERTVLFGQLTQCWSGNNWTFGACNTEWRDAVPGPTTGSWVIPMTYSQLGTGPFALYIQATDVATNVNATNNPIDSWS